MPTWGSKRGGGRGNGGAGDDNREKRPHHHSYQEINRKLVREGPFKGKYLVFLKCTQPQCPKPDKAEIEE